MRFSKSLILIIIFVSFIVMFSVKQEGKSGQERLNNSPTPNSLGEHKTPQEAPHFLENGCPKNERQAWVVGKAIGCKLSPNGKFIGKFIFNGLYNPERYYELVIMKGNKEWTVFAGDYRTLGWEWTKDKRVKILYNCGVGCKAVKEIGLDQTVLISDYMDGRMNEKNGWGVEFSGL